MRVDFYQLGASSPEAVIATIAGKVTAIGERLLVVADDEAFLTRLDRLLWSQDEGSFLPHALAGGVEDARQPVLLSTSEDAPNLARNLLIADGRWREAALSFERAFFLFAGEATEDARLAWKLLSGRDGVDRRYWAQDDGKWVEKG
ncbi:MAG: DNA polymerase III subunit chi [Pseudomonadota bacterium]